MSSNNDIDYCSSALMTQSEHHWVMRICTDNTSK